jgi:AcrR family transcriptional regulator
MTREPGQDAPPQPSAAQGAGDRMAADGAGLYGFANGSAERAQVAQIDAGQVGAVVSGAAQVAAEEAHGTTGQAGRKRPRGPSRGIGVRPRRPSMGGGIPAQGRELGTQGRQTVRRLLEAGLIEFDEKGFNTVRVDDVVRRAKTSHGTFYLYFANKDDLFRTLLLDALHDMELITDDFPIVTSNEAGRAALRRWIESFTDTYTAHGTVIRVLSQADVVGEEVYGDGLRMLFRLSEAIAQGMTAARRRSEPPGGGTEDHAELTALACLMMLERVNYLISADVRLPREEMIDRLSSIIYAAFHAP